MGMVVYYTFFLCSPPRTTYIRAAIIATRARRVGTTAEEELTSVGENGLGDGGLGGLGDGGLGEGGLGDGVGDGVGVGVAEPACIRSRGMRLSLLPMTVLKAKLL